MTDEIRNDDLVEQFECAVMCRDRALCAKDAESEANWRAETTRLAALLRDHLIAGGAG